MSKLIKTRRRKTRPRRLQCAVCGQTAWGRQWWNQDTGFGVCTRCGDQWSALSKDELGSVERAYGPRGEYWGIDRTKEE